MKNVICGFLLIASFVLSGCSGGGGGGAGGGSTGPAPGGPPTANPKTTAYQDQFYLIPISASLSINSVAITNGPSWLSFNPSKGTVEGTPNDNVSINGMNLAVTTSDGVTTTLGPFNISVLGDPLKKYQWHLTNTGQTTFASTPGVAGFDISQAQTIASGILGSGVRVAISDGGVQIAHEDLAANILPGTSKNYNLSPRTLVIQLPQEVIKTPMLMLVMVPQLRASLAPLGGMASAGVELLQAPHYLVSGI